MIGRCQLPNSVDLILSCTEAHHKVITTVFPFQCNGREANSGDPALLKRCWLHTIGADSHLGRWIVMVLSIQLDDWKWSLVRRKERWHCGLSDKDMGVILKVTGYTMSHYLEGLGLAIMKLFSQYSWL